MRAHRNFQSAHGGETIGMSESDNRHEPDDCVCTSGFDAGREAIGRLMSKDPLLRQPHEKRCKECDALLVKEADLGAPGKGSSYDCPMCHTKHWVYGTTCVPFKDISCEDVSLTIEDVI